MGELGRDGCVEARLEAASVDELLRDLLLADLAASNNGFFLCQSETLRLIWANGRGRALLDSGRQLALVSASLAAADRRLQASLDGLARQQPGAAIVIPAIADCEALVLRARRLGDLSTPDRAFVSLTAYSLSRTADFVLPDLSGVYDLTPAEMRVLSLLASGLTADGLSLDLGISIETARTHIRRIYAKMNVSSREELICLANRYRVP